MEKTRFELRFDDLRWITDPPDIDLCAHGSVFARIGSEVIVAPEDGDHWTLSAASLFLMRSLTEARSPGDERDGWLIPCCGFTMWTDDEGRTIIPGCMEGREWGVEHFGESVTLTSGDSIVTVPAAHYRAEVFREVDRVADFYRSSPPRALPSDASEREGYKAMWREWERLRGAPA